MKKLFIAALMMVGMTSFAQEAKPMRVNNEISSEQKIERDMKRLSVELNLEATQQKEMQIVLNEGVSKRAEMTKEFNVKRPTSTPKAADVSEKRKMMLTEFETVENAKLQKILTPEQFSKYQKIKMEREEKMKTSK